MSAHPPIVVRTALVSDVAPCARLFAAGQQEIEPKMPCWSAEEFPDQIAGEDILVAVAGQQTVGFVTVWRPDAFVHFLHTALPWRRRGVGRHLLAAARAEVGRPLELKCLVGNRLALAFYQRLGWRRVGAEDGSATPYVRLRQPR
jgi:GNAT superfamily N-acetyltransferase